MVSFFPSFLTFPQLNLGQLFFLDPPILFLNDYSENNHFLIHWGHALNVEVHGMTYPKLWNVGSLVWAI